jgi:2-methylisocitrate lyase-like PEP mutase family enzyme
MASGALSLRPLVDSGRTLVLPGAANALTARIVEDIGFEAVYVTGAGLTNTLLGSPDIGLLSLPELVSQVIAIRNAVDIPIVVDADTGFGNAVNVWNAVRLLESAGGNAVQLEDQTFPKRCGHFSGTEVIDCDEMVQKVRAAVEARSTTEFLIIARTDARASHGLDEACKRANAYRDAGADVAFVEGPRTEEEIIQIAETVDGPKILNLVEGGLTPPIALQRIEELGFAIALYANLALLASIRAEYEILTWLRGPAFDKDRPNIATGFERQRLVRKASFDALAERFSGLGDE